MIRDVNFARPAAEDSRTTYLKKSPAMARNDS